MLVLFETPLGFCLFKFNEGKFSSDDLWKEFETPERASAALKLKAIHRFSSTAAAVEDITAMQEGKVSKGLKQFLTEEIVNKGKGKEKLAVVDKTLAGTIHKKLGIDVVSGSESLDLYRGIRQQLATLLDGLDPADMATMSLGLSHSLSRFKLKFSPDKVDTMVVQAIALLDDLDKEVNIYSMRVKEWYGWHFPEMGKIVVDNIAYARVVRTMGLRTNAATTSLASVLPEELEATLKAAANLSMGSEISEQDIDHIHHLCDQVISIAEYRSQLSEYLRNRMNAIAPNLTVLVGELVGARLISHAGSLTNLAKHPASTVQILGAEKALFRALKSKHDTPKYGLIYHASLVGQAPPKLKGKMSRMLATKASLSVRVDALSDVDAKSSLLAPSVGLEYRAKLESRLRALEYRSDLNPGFGAAASSSFMQKSRQQQKFEMDGTATKIYNNAADSVMIPTQPLIGNNSDVDLTNVAKALDAVMDVKDERRRRKEEKRAAKEAKKEKKKAKDVATADTQVEAPAQISNAMDVDDEEAARKEKKRLKKEKKQAEAAAAAAAAASDASDAAPASASVSAVAAAAANIGSGEKKDKKRHTEGEEAPKKKKKKSE